LLVYAPHPGLFNDVAGDLYNATPSPVRAEALVTVADEALAIIGAYSDQLYHGILETVRTIAFTSDDHQVTRSFSMRTAYPGGVFSARCDPIALAENIIHEYYHCRLWTWWLIERPQDLPGDDISITSPVTGMSRPVATMMHAALIYFSLIDFYRVLCRDIDKASDCTQRRFCEGRLQQLERGAPAVLHSLRNMLQDRPESLRFVDIVAQAGGASTRPD
jgi:HEXXH motif-containing protein